MKMHFIKNDAKLLQCTSINDAEKKIKVNFVVNDAESKKRIFKYFLIALG